MTFYGICAIAGAYRLRRVGNEVQRGVRASMRPLDGLQRLLERGWHAKFFNLFTVNNLRNIVDVQQVVAE